MESRCWSPIDLSRHRPDWPSQAARSVFVWLSLLLTPLFAAPCVGQSTPSPSGKPTPPSAAPGRIDDELRARVEALYEVSWERFYLPKTQIFYDYLTSYKPGRWLAHLPIAEEVRRQYPNECGYDTGMEDGMISAGVMLSLIIDRYAVTGEKTLREDAMKVYQGIRRCASVHGQPGFVARAVCPEDATSVYPNSSRDQYTHAVDGLWLFANSPLCPPARRAEIGETLSRIADRMTQNVTAENGYDSLRLDGSRDTRGISRMWNVQPHEAARLPMIYAAAWDVTRDPNYRRLYEKYIDAALEQSGAIDGSQPTYALLQVQVSMELLRSIETDPQRIRHIGEVMRSVAELCADRATKAHRRAESLDLTKLATDWRSGGGLSSKGDYRPVWYCIRESGEAALGQCLAGNGRLSDEQQELLEIVFQRLDPDRVSSCGIFYLQAAYWKSLRAAVEDVPK